MNRDRFLRVKELFRQSLPLTPEQQLEYLDRECGDDAELRAEIVDLLDHAASAGTGFLASSTHSAENATMHPTLEIVGFRIVERLAVGGSGVVYLARQAAPSRDVAIKVLRLDTLGAGQVARFAREAEILASLNHPGIAQVHGAGVIEQGPLALPWIAMELVRGATLDEYVVAEKLDIPALLALFRELCAAVEHAHERGVVHRDLKPSNVLVEPSGRPRVLDFGVAKILGDADAAGGKNTRTGALVGTLAYMAPEQARGDRAAIDARVDVYALGAMLYEAIAGRPPLDLEGLDVIDAAHVICFAEPAALTSLRADLPADLDAIVAKAMEKDAKRRYSSAGALALDLVNLLEHRPVRARRPTTIDQARKFMRRNRTVTIATLVVVASLVTALTVALIALRSQERQRAVTSETIDFIAGLMSEFSPRLGFGEDQRPTLIKTVARIEGQLQIDPGSRGLRAAHAQMLYLIAELDHARSDWQPMRSRLETALAIREGLVREDPADTSSWAHISSISARIGETYREQGDLDRRDEWFARSLAIDERLAAEHPEEPEFLEDLGWSLERVSEAARERGDHALAESLAQRRLDDALELYAIDPDSWKFALNLSHAHSVITAQLSLAGDMEPAVEHAIASVRLARITLDMEPGRRDFVYWLARSLGIAAEALRLSEKYADSLVYVEDAFVTAEQVALLDPRRPPHLDYVIDIARRYADPQLGEQARDRCHRAIGCLRRVAKAAARVGVPTTDLELAAEALASR